MPEFPKKFSRLANRLLASRHAIPGRRLALAYRGAITWAAYRRYVKSRDRADLDKAIEAFTTLVVLMPDTHPRKAAVLHIRGILLSDRVEHTGAVSDIDEMITTYENAVRLADSHDIPVYLGKLGKGYATRFEETAELPDADKAIDALTRAVNATTEEGETKADRLCDVGDILLARLQKGRDLADGDRALVSYEAAIQAMPSVDPDLPHYLDNLANAHLVRSEYSHDIRDIDNAITTLLRAVGLTEQGCTPESRPFVLTNLGNAYMKKYGMTDDSKDFDHAVQAQQEVLGMTADDPTSRVTFLNNLGLVYLTQFKLHEALEDVDQAIAHLQEASVLAKSGHGDLAGCLTNLGDALSRRFARSGSLTDIDKAITLHEEAVLASQDDTKAACHCNLGTALLSRFERSQDLSDVDRSVRAHSAAVDLTPERNADKATYLNGLGVACRNRFRLTLDMKDIDDAILNHESALGLLSDEHPERAATLSSLGAAYGARFLYRGEPASDIDRAITSQSDAVRLTGETSPDRANRLRNLAIAWSQKFDRTGDLIDIGEAILKAEDAVRCTVDDHAALPANLACLAVCLSSRFDRSGELADVDRAITVMEEAVKLAPEDSVDKAMCLSGLGHSFMARFERTKDVKDIDQAVHCSDESVGLTPDSQAEDRAISLGNLGRALKHRFDHLKEPKDLDSAVDALQRCLDLTQHDNVDKPHRLGELASAFTARFVCSGERADIDGAITMYEDAVALLPNGHSGESNLLSSLGHALLSRYEAHIQSAPDDRRAAARHFRLAAQSPTGLPLVRFRAALEWARLSVAMSDSSEQSYLDGYGLALELLQRVAWVGQTITARHREIAALGNIASEAAAAAITAGNASLAVKWLEQGRSVIWGQLLRLRSPVDELRAHDERLADDLEQVTKALEQTSTRVVYNFPFSPRSLRDPRHMAAEHVAQRHLLLAQEWDMLIARARAYSPDFLRAREVTDLAAAASDGPIVVVNAHPSRCDALILRDARSKVEHVPLSLSMERAKDMLYTMRTDLVSANLRVRTSRHAALVLPNGRGSPDTRMADMLGELWDCVVCPVFTHLGITEVFADDVDPPRLWWCMTGLLAFLPIHAAGLYARLPGEGAPGTCVLDHVACSRHRNRDRASILFVSQPDTPGQQPIPNTTEEMRLVRKHALGQARHLPVQCSFLEGRQATIDAVVKGMEEYSWVHFACHGVQNTADPMASAFCLYDGMLKLSSIIEKSLPNAEFAFLSACQTATGDEALPDEAVHLAAGMQLAGYGGVVATLWSIMDDDAPVVAENVYAHLMADNACDPDSRQAAVALRRAVQALRRRRPKSMLSWLPFIHVGI